MPQLDAPRDLERLVARALALEDEASRQSVPGVVTVLLELHRRALARVLALVSDGPGGPALVSRLAADAEVSPLLALHDIHPVALSARVGQVLDECRPGLQAQGRDVEFVRIDQGGRVHVRLHGPVEARAAATVRATLEAAVYEAAPEVTSVIVDVWTSTADPEAHATDATPASAFAR